MDPSSTPLPPRQCEVCHAQEKLLDCGGCRAVSYCGQAHQAAHREVHKRECKAVRKCRTTLDAEEARLRALPGDLMTPPNVFEEGEGHFWGIFETRQYMRHRYALVEALLEIPTRRAVQQALTHLMDMLRLCRGDNMGLRSVVPALMLRLGKDQECYDFIKWWCTTAEASNYDWGDTDLPYLDLKNADVFEPCDFISPRWPDLSQAVAVTLLKVRLLIDLRTLQDGSHAVGDLLRSRPDVLGLADHTRHIADLEEQVRKLYMLINNVNTHFWPALLDPDEHLDVKPGLFSPGDISEAQLTLRYSYLSWIETPGAIDHIEMLM